MGDTPEERTSVLCLFCMNNKPGSPIWNSGKSGNINGKLPLPRLSWKEVILSVGNQETPEQWKHLGATYKEAAVKKVFNLIIEGRAPGLLIDLMKYSEPTPQELVAEIRSVSEYTSYGVDKRLIIESVKDMVRKLAASQSIEIIDGEIRVIRTRELPEQSIPGEPAGEPVSSSPPEDNRREEDREAPVVPNIETTITH